MKTNEKKNTVILFYPLVEKTNANQNLSWALLYLERNLRDLDINLILIDERLNSDYEELIIGHKDSLLLAGVSCMIGFQLVGALKFSSLIKKHSSSPVIWGGWFPTVFTELVLNEKNVDFICVGQGEEPLRLLIYSLLNNLSEFKINGIIRTSDDLILEEKQTLVNYESLPALNLNIFDINKIIDKESKVDYGFRGTDYLATIGCPYNCAFCNLTYIFGQNWFPKPVNNIISDIEILVRNGNLSHITFSDDNFFVSKSFTMEFCNKLLASGIKITWEANTHVKTFLKIFGDAEILKIKESGCTRIKIGAESGDQDILDLINKKTLVKENLKIVKILKQYDIGVRFYTMIAFPHNPDRDTNRTLTLIAQAKKTYNKFDFNINIFKPIPKTDIFPLAQSFGFEYPKTINGLLKLLETNLKFPWHKRDYYKIVDAFIGVYIPSLNFSNYKNHKGIEKIVYFLIDIYFHINTLIRIKLNFWKLNTFANYIIKKTKQSNTLSPTENVAILKSR